MKQVLDFIIQYWHLIVDALAVIISLIICCIKKRPVEVVDTMKELIVRLLPYCICEAESAPKGEKLAACLSYLKLMLFDRGFNLTADYEKFAASQVELILTTPQKKGK